VDPLRGLSGVAFNPDRGRAKGAAKQYHNTKQKKIHWGEFLADNNNI
jgi:hypothetical protein